MISSKRGRLKRFQRTVYPFRSQNEVKHDVSSTKRAHVAKVRFTERLLVDLFDANGFERVPGNWRKRLTTLYLLHFGYSYTL